MGFKVHSPHIIIYIYIPTIHIYMLVYVWRYLLRRHKTLSNTVCHLFYNIVQCNLYKKTKYKIQKSINKKGKGFDRMKENIRLTYGENIIIINMLLCRYTCHRTPSLFVNKLCVFKGWNAFGYRHKKLYKI